MKKGQALLAYLARRPGQFHSREKLSALLWGDHAEEQARHSLRQTLVGIRKLLGDEHEEILLTKGDTVAIDPATEVDVLIFERLASETTPNSLERASDLYQGDYLEGFSLKDDGFDEWMIAERERLWELALEVLAKLLAHQVRGKAYEAAVQTSLRLLKLDPTQEGVHRTLMQLYDQLGRREAALRQYQTCVSMLQRELSVEPDQRTRELYDRILQRAGDSPSVVLEEFSSQPLRVLIVEDEPVTRTVLEEFLRSGGYDVVVSEDGADALLHLGKQKFDAVLSDIFMPNLDGLKLLEIMSQNHIDSPAIFLTALSDQELEVRGFELGAADFIRKPVRKDILLLRVRNAIRRGRPRVAFNRGE
jgi:DNA-binding SARP family transcriptional activator/ActR/RegA family two-component response regulator